MDIMKIHHSNNFINYFEKKQKLWKNIRATGEMTPCGVTIAQVAKLQLLHLKKNSYFMRFEGVTYIFYDLKQAYIINLNA
jgi:hypothetical protein